jgi:hypothetical protein
MRASFVAGDAGDRGAASFPACNLHENRAVAGSVGVSAIRELMLI